MNVARVPFKTPTERAALSLLLFRTAGWDECDDRQTRLQAPRLNARLLPVSDPDCAKRQLHHHPMTPFLNPLLPGLGSARVRCSLPYRLFINAPAGTYRVRRL